MAGRRVERLNEQFKRELMDLVQHEVKDPRVAMVTVTAVRAAPDLSFARVFLTSIAPVEQRPTILEGLRAAAPYLRGELGRRLRVRRAPELAFEWDDTLDHAQRIERLISEVRDAESQRREGEDDVGDDDE